MSISFLFSQAEFVWVFKFEGPLNLVVCNLTYENSLVVKSCNSLSLNKTRDVSRSKKRYCY